VGGGQGAVGSEDSRPNPIKLPPVVAIGRARSVSPPSAESASLTHVGVAESDTTKNTKAATGGGGSSGMVAVEVASWKKSGTPLCVRWVSPQSSFNVCRH
jgi:hypothetical protein